MHGSNTPVQSPVDSADDIMTTIRKNMMCEKSYSGSILVLGQSRWVAERCLCDDCPCVSIGGYSQRKLVPLFSSVRLGGTSS